MKDPLCTRTNPAPPLAGQAGAGMATAGIVLGWIAVAWIALRLLLVAGVGASSDF